MATYNKLKMLFSERIRGRKEPETVAVICAEDGSISGNTFTPDVDGRSGYIFAKLFTGEVIQVYNGVLDIPILGQVIKLGRIPGTDRMQVRSIWDVFPTANPGGDQWEPHDHTWPSPETTWVKREQILYWTVIPNGADPFTVKVFGGVVFINGAWMGINNIDIDVEASIPSQGARWVLIQAAVDGTITTMNGVIVSNKYALFASYVPKPDTANWPIAAVRVYAGQEFVSQTEFDNDILPLAWGAGYSGDMYTSVYDSNNNGVVDDSERLGGVLASEYMLKSQYDPEDDGLWYERHVISVHEGDFDLIRLDDGTPVMVEERII